MTLTVLKNKNIFFSALCRLHRFKSGGTAETREKLNKRSLTVALVPSKTMLKALKLRKSEPVNLQISPELIKQTAGLVFAWLTEQASLSQSATTGNALFDKHILNSMAKTHFGNESVGMRITSNSVGIPMADNNNALFFEPKDDPSASILARLYAHGDSHYGPGNPVIKGEHLYKSPVQILLENRVSKEKAYSYLREVHQDLITAQTLAALAALPERNPIKDLVFSPFGLTDLPDFSEYPKLVGAFGGLTHEILVRGREELSKLGFDTAVKGSKIGGFLLLGPDGKPEEKTWYSIFPYWTTVHYSALERGGIKLVPCLTFTLGRLQKSQVAGLVSPEKSGTEEEMTEEQGVKTEESGDESFRQPRSIAVIGSKGALGGGEQDTQPAPVQPATAEEVAQMSADQEVFPSNLLQGIYGTLVVKDPAISPIKVIERLEQLPNQNLPAIRFYKLLLESKALMLSAAQSQGDYTEALNLLEQADRIGHPDKVLVSLILKGMILSSQGKFDEVVELLDPYVSEQQDNSVLQYLYFISCIDRFESQRKNREIVELSDPIFAQTETAIERIKKLATGKRRSDLFQMEISFPKWLVKSMVLHERGVLSEKISLILQERNVEEAIPLMEKLIKLVDRAPQEVDTKKSEEERLSVRDLIVDDLIRYTMDIYLSGEKYKNILSKLKFRTWCEEQLRTHTDRFTETFRKLPRDIENKIGRGELTLSDSGPILQSLQKIVDEVIRKIDRIGKGAGKPREIEKTHKR